MFRKIIIIGFDNIGIDIRILFVKLYLKDAPCILESRDFYLMSSGSFSEVNRLPRCEEKEVVEKSKDFTIRLVDGEEHSPPITRQIPQCSHYKEGSCTIPYVHI